MVSCNTTLEDGYISEEALWKGFTFHHFGLFLCAIFGLISVVVSLWLIAMHASHYLRPLEQKQIIRILFMIPVYSIVSFLSYMFYRKAVYFQVLRDCYEAFAISSFFALLCHYIAPNLHDQKDYFRSVQPKNWFLGVFWLQKCTGGENRGPFRKPRSGLTWFNVIWAGIFQYCLIRVFFTIVSVVTEAFDRYCEASLSPAFAHIWVLAFESASVTVAMFMVIQFYIQLKDDLAEHKPFLKVLSIKLVIFFSFWQTIIISLLSSSNGPLKPTKNLAYQDIKIGIPSVLLCIEMAGFSFMHVFAYSWKPYSIKHMSADPLMSSGSGYSGEMPRYQGGPFGIKAIMEAFNPWDIIKSIARGFRWVVVGAKHRRDDISYQSRKLDANNISYMGPTFSSTGGAATELRPSPERRPDGSGTDGVFDDRAGLLRHSQLPASTSPYRAHDANDYLAASGDLGSSSRQPQPPPAFLSSGPGMDMKPSERDGYDDEDVDYHPGTGPSLGASSARNRTSVLGPSGSVHVHPAYRPPQQYGGGSGSQGPPVQDGYGYGQGPPPPGYR